MRNKVESFIFEQKPNRQEILDSAYYTLSGQEDYMDENGNPRISSEKKMSHVFAKRIVRDGSTPKYSIKIGLDNKFMNPASIYDNYNKGSTFLDNVCRANNKFVDVNKKVFDMYLKFLQTKNLSWFYNAEREMF